MEPTKCPDCSTWWRGETHRCADVAAWIDKLIADRQATPHICICTSPHSSTIVVRQMAGHPGDHTPFAGA